MKIAEAAGKIAKLLSVAARDATGLIGAGLISYGAWLAWHPAGFMAAGTMAAGMAWLLGSGNDG